MALRRAEACIHLRLGSTASTGNVNPYCVRSPNICPVTKGQDCQFGFSANLQQVKTELTNTSENPPYPVTMQLPVINEKPISAGELNERALDAISAIQSATLKIISK